jgi:lysozyme
MPTQNQINLANALIKQCEGLKLNAYYDTNNVPTIGIGTTRYPNGVAVKIGDTCTFEQSYQYLDSHLNKFIFPAVDNLQQKYEFDDYVYAAMCSLSYNVGSALAGESILAALKDGCKNELGTAFRKYINSGGEPCQGLINRREIEIKFFNQNEA